MNNVPTYLKLITWQEATIPVKNRDASIPRELAFINKCCIGGIYLQEIKEEGKADVIRWQAFSFLPSNPNRNPLGAFAQISEAKDAVTEFVLTWYEWISTPRWQDRQVDRNETNRETLELTAPVFASAAEGRRHQFLTKGSKE